MQNFLTRRNLLATTFLAFATLIAPLSASNAQTSDVDKIVGFALASQKDSKVLANLKTLAQREDPAAQVSLMLYYHVQGKEDNANHWAKKAAKNKDKRGEKWMKEVLLLLAVVKSNKN